MAELSLQHLDKIYDNGVQAVFDFNMDVADGELIVMVGPSGCGTAGTSPRGRRRTATWPWSSRTTRSTAI